MRHTTFRRSGWRSPRTLGLRQGRVDAWRVIAVLFVVLGHSEVIFGYIHRDWLSAVQVTLHAFGRFAVPFFLLLAGHHLGLRLVKDRGAGTIWPYERRLLRLLVLGSALYWLVDLAKLVKARGLTAGLMEVSARLLSFPGLLVPPRRHLWFLAILMTTALFAVLLLNRSRLRVLAAASALMYPLALATGAYAPVLGLDGVPGIVPALLEGPLYFALGIGLSVVTPQAHQARVGWALVAAGVALSSAELLVLFEHRGRDVFRIGSVAGTLPLTAGVGLLALRAGASRVERWAALGAPYVPAVYINHVLFLELLRPPRAHLSVEATRIVLPVVAAAAAFATAWAVGRLRMRIARRRRALRRRGPPGGEPAGDPVTVEGSALRRRPGPVPDDRPASPDPSA
jgi:surface polysaccharide O-acyltransferase-like enzyme